jgi:hypothetical protein
MEHKMTKNLWGSVEPPETLRTPHSLLVEQAAYLKEMTEGLLYASVYRVPAPIQNVLAPNRSPRFTSTLSIVAPALAAYSYQVLSATYPVSLYPVLVEITGTKPETRCDNEEAFLAAIAEALTSGQTRRVVQGLLAQIKSDTKHP